MDVERAVSDAVFDLLCMCESDPEEGCEPDCQANEHYDTLGTAVLDALRQVPTSDLIEALGMSLDEVVVTHWRTVAADGGIVFSISSREEARAENAIERASYWLKYADHIEVWEQRYMVTKATWRRVDGND